MGAPLSDRIPEPVDILREAIARGLTGTLAAGPMGGGGHAVQLMVGEIVAATGPDDGIWLIRRLTAQGALTEKQGVAYTRALEHGKRHEDLLVGQVPTSLYIAALEHRFRQNVLDFLRSDDAVSFELQRGLFPDHAHVDHDSTALVDDLLALQARVDDLRHPAARGVHLRPGPQMPGSQEEARLLDLADPSISLGDLVTFSPFEEGRTLELVRAMLDVGSLIADRDLAPRPEPVPGPASGPAADFAVEELFSLEESASLHSLQSEPPVEATAVAPAEPAGPERFDAVLGRLGAGRRLGSAFVAAAAVEQHSLPPIDGDWGDEVPPDYAGPLPEPAFDDVFDDELLDELAEAFDHPGATGEPVALRPDADLAAALAEAVAATDDDTGAVAEAGVEPLAAEAPEAAGALDALDDDVEDFDEGPGPDDTTVPILIERQPSVHPLNSLHDVEPVMTGAPSTTAGDTPRVAADPGLEEPDSLESAFLEPLEELPDIEPPPPAPSFRDADTRDAEPVPDAPTATGALPSEPIPAAAPAPPLPEDADPDEAFPEVAAALRRARAAEARREAARSFAEFDDEDLLVSHPPRTDLFEFDDAVDDDTMAFFKDHDRYRGGGDGQFTLKKDLLDVVDLGGGVGHTEEVPADIFLPRQDDDDGMLEMGEANESELTAEDKVVALSFSAPKLEEDELARKLEVASVVLGHIAAALDARLGPGAGQASVQLLLDGAPSMYAVLFHGVEARLDGTIDVAAVARNIRRRPESEHRGLLDRGIMDLIERGLSYAVEEVDDPSMDRLLQQIAGYQQRLRS